MKDKTPPGETIYEGRGSVVDAPTSAPKRKPFRDYGFRKGAILRMLKPEHEFRGEKRILYMGHAKKHADRPVEEYLKSAPNGTKEARDMLRAMIREGVIRLEGGAGKLRKRREKLSYG